MSITSWWSRIDPNPLGHADAPQENFRKSCILSIWKSKIFIKNRGFSSRSDEKFPFTVLYNKNLLRTRLSVISDISGTHWLPRIHLSKGIPYTRHNLRHHLTQIQRQKDWQSDGWCCHNNIHFECERCFFFFFQYKPKIIINKYLACFVFFALSTNKLYIDSYYIYIFYFYPS